jgi:hypothetical protein
MTEAEKASKEATEEYESDHDDGPLSAANDDDDKGGGGSRRGCRRLPRC